MMVVLPFSCIWYVNLLSVSWTVSAVACIFVSSCWGLSAMIGIVSSSMKLASLRCTCVVGVLSGTGWVSGCCCACGIVIVMSWASRFCWICCMMMLIL